MKSSVFSGFVAVSVIALTFTSAQAAFQIAFDNGAGTAFTVIDNGTGDTDLTVGRISFQNGTGFTMPGYSTLQVDSTSMASAASSTLSTTQLDILSSASASLSLAVSDQFTLPLGSPLDLEQTLGGLQTPAGTGQATVDQVSKLISGVTTTTPNSHLVVNTVNRAPAGQSSGILAPRTPGGFTMETDISIAFVDGFNGQLNHNTSVLPPSNATVPEPASLLVWSGLMAIGIVGATGRGRIHRSS